MPTNDESSRARLAPSPADELLEVLWLCAPSLSLSIASGVLVAFVPQAHEALRAALENFMDGFYGPLLALVGAVPLASLALWYWARVTLYATVDGLSGRQDGPFPASRVQRWAVHNVPRIAGLLPWLAVAFGFYEAELLVTPRNGGRAVLHGLPWVVAGAALYVAQRYRRQRMGARGYVPEAAAKQSRFVAGSRYDVDLTHWSRTTTRILAAAIVLFLVVVVATAATHGAWAQGSGPIAIVFVWVGTWVSLVAALRLLGKYHGLPVLSFLGALAILTNARDCNDNHAVRALAGRAPARGGTMMSAFRRWYATRVDRARFGGAYPVFVVATEGGGIRAAYFTASLLATLQDRCPAFAHHVLAVSGVSGGSVGDAVFSATVASRPPYDTTRVPAARACLRPAVDSGDYSRVAHEVLGRDLLSPVVATALNVDLIQRAVLPLFPREDRAQALELGLERGWDDAMRAEPPNAGRFAAPFDALVTHPDVPLPLFNATLVGSGDRAVVTTLDTVEMDTIKTLHELDPALDVRLSTAAVLSARFTYVTPEGVIRRGGVKERLIDGGYFDDSGMTTARDMVEAIEGDSLLKDSVRVVVLRFAFEAPPRMRGRFSGTDSAQRARRADSTRVHALGNGFAELVTPVRGLLNTRAAHARAVVRQYHEELDRAAKAPNAARTPQILDFWLREDSVPLVLGWYLSKKARANIDAKTKRCADGDPVAGAPPSCDSVLTLLHAPARVTPP